MRRLLERHRARYLARCGTPYPVVWGRDGQLLKRLLATYDEPTLERLQDAFFAQPLDSSAGRHGYTVPGLFTEAPALAARLAAQDALTPEQAARRARLEALGCDAATALALVTEVPLAQIDRQLDAWPRRTGIRRPAAALPRAIREDWPLPDADDEPPPPRLPEPGPWLDEVSDPEAPPVVAGAGAVARAALARIRAAGLSGVRGEGGDR